jgi:uncharacterized protein YbjT (DUF2867 family)
MKIFLTGATGFMGGELLKALHARGHEMTALVRDPKKAKDFPQIAAPGTGCGGARGGACQNVGSRQI